MGSFTLTESGINGALAFALEEASAPAYVSQLAGPILSSQQETEKYRFAGMSPALRQWVGERQAKRIREFSQDTPNVKYEATLEVFNEEIRWDRTGQVQRRIDDLASRAAKHWGALMTSLLEDNNAAYDGTAYFSDSHTNDDGATVDNITTTNASDDEAPTAAEMEAAILDMIEAMMGFQDDAGEPVNEDLSSILVMVPPKYASAAASAISNPIIVDGSASRTNVLTNAMGEFSVRKVVNPRLTSTNDYIYAFRVDGQGGMGPFYRQADIPSESDSDTADVMIQSQGETSDYYFDTDKMRFGVKAYRAVDYGDYRKAVRHTFT